MAKKIDKDPDIKDSYKALAEYIAAAREEGEKLEEFWMVNFAGGEDLDALDFAIAEAEAVQDMNQNPQAKECKTYHLVVSFRPGERPDKATLMAMEAEYAKALGFADHQRVCGFHTNTDNNHFHVAYNMIHPETFRKHTPFGEFKDLANVTRRLERRYGFFVDRGMTDKDYQRGQTNQKAANYEARTWEESFDSFLQNNKDELLKELAACQSWPEVKEVTDRYSIQFKKHGNGLVIENLADYQKGVTTKASSLSRSLSKTALEKRLGPIPDNLASGVAHQVITSPKAKHSANKAYSRKPITRNRLQGKLWQRFIEKSTRASRQKSLLGKAFRYWREFLYADALNDPMAMAIIYLQKRMMEELTSPFILSGKQNPPPRTLDPAFKKWEERELNTIAYIEAVGAFDETAISFDDIMADREFRKEVREREIEDRELNRIAYIEATGAFEEAAISSEDIEEDRQYRKAFLEAQRKERLEKELARLGYIEAVGAFDETAISLDDIMADKEFRKNLKDTARQQKEDKQLAALAYIEAVGTFVETGLSLKDALASQKPQAKIKSAITKDKGLGR